MNSILIPSVCRTVSTLPSWQVGFPLSISIMNRKPVPEVMAKSFWVTPMLLRVFLTNSPIFSGIYFTAHGLMLPSGNITPFRGQIK